MSQCMSWEASVLCDFWGGDFDYDFDDYEYDTEDICDDEEEDWE